jgi:hypothetical protein
MTLVDIVSRFRAAWRQEEHQHTPLTLNAERQSFSLSSNEKRGPKTISRASRICFSIGTLRRASMSSPA